MLVMLIFCRRWLDVEVYLFRMLLWIVEFCEGWKVCIRYCLCWWIRIMILIFVFLLIYCFFLCVVMCWKSFCVVFLGWFWGFLICVVRLYNVLMVFVILFWWKFSLWVDFLLLIELMVFWFDDLLLLLLDEFWVFKFCVCCLNGRWLFFRIVRVFLRWLSKVLSRCSSWDLIRMVLWIW